jgi:hypothetical protein
MTSAPTRTLQPRCDPSQAIRKRHDDVRGRCRADGGPKKADRADIACPLRLGGERRGEEASR